MDKIKKIKNVIKKRKGFTLIELLLVMAIIAMAIGLSLMSFGDSKSIDEVDVAVRNLASLVREAQNNSLTGKQQVWTGTLSNMCLNGLEWDGNNVNDSAFTVFSYVSDFPNACALANGRVDVRSETMKNVNVDAVDNSPGASVFFAVPDGAISTNGFALIGGVASTAKIKITSVRDSLIYGLVCVYPTGRVEEVIGSANCP